MSNVTKDEPMDYTTAECDWTDRDADIIATYLTFKELGAKNVSELSLPKQDNNKTR